MWGTIARMRVRPDVPEEYLLAQLRAYKMGRAEGFIGVDFLHSDADPRELWLVAMYEDKATYRANAESAAQHAIYLTLRACLEDEPEWHDVDSLASIRPGRPPA